jgi:hypothetical protein
LVLDGHDPHPALVVDRRWNLVAANRGLGALLDGVAPELLEPPGNAMRIALHPDGLAPRIANHAEWRAHLLARLERQAAMSGDDGLEELLEEVVAYPAPRYDAPPPAHDIFVPFRLYDGEGELKFFSTVSTFGTAVDITVAELSIESFFPADAYTADAMRGLAAAAA